MRKVILDLETSFSYRKKFKGGKWKEETDYGSPHNPNNSIVCIGCFDIERREYVLFDLKNRHNRNDVIEYLKQFNTIIGHNIKYDANWLRSIGFSYKNTTLVDTLIREYVLNGGKETFQALGLDKLAPKYGGTNKIDLIKYFWLNGVNTDEIPDYLLHKYLYLDVYNTAKIYLGQEAHKNRKRFASMLKMNDDLCKVTAEMEWNGFTIDIDKADDIKQKFEGYVKSAERELFKSIAKNHPAPEEFKLGSSQQLQRLLYSLELKSEMREHWKDNYKSCRTQAQLDRLVEECFNKLDYGFHVKPQKRFAGANGFGTGKKAVEILFQNADKLSKKAKTFIEAYVDYGNKKTWLDKNYWALRNGIDEDGKVHGNFNQAGTKSGRYSASNPNLQNIPSKKKNDGMNNMREMIVSRYGDEGVIVSPDYSQLELRAVMELAGAKKGFYDFDHDVDIHTDKAKWAIDYYKGKGSWDEATDEQRAIWRDGQKAVNFGLIFGLQPKDDLQKAMFEAFYNDYPEVRDWNGRVEAEILAKQAYAAKPLDGWCWNFKGATHDNFKYGYAADGRGWRNKALNYPVQGFAGRIMQVAMIGCYERTKNEKHIHFIGQVHDEVLFDCHKKELDKLMEIVQYEMENVGKRFKSYFGHEIRVKLNVDLEYGDNWFNVRGYKK